MPPGAWACLVRGLVSGLAERLVACSGFRWLPGMRVLPDAANGAARCVLATETQLVFALEQSIGWSRDGGPCVEAWSEDAVSGEELPDLEDAATLGALLELVRAAYPSAWGIAVVPKLDGAGWSVESHLPPEDLNAGQPDEVLGEGASAAEALVCALDPDGEYTCAP